MHACKYCISAATGLGFPGDRPVDCSNSSATPWDYVPAVPATYAPTSEQTDVPAAAEQQQSHNGAQSSVVDVDASNNFLALGAPSAAVPAAGPPAQMSFTGLPAVQQSAAGSAASASAGPPIFDTGDSCIRFGNHARYTVTIPWRPESFPASVRNRARPSELLFRMTLTLPEPFERVLRNVAVRSHVSLSYVSCSTCPTPASPLLS